MPIADDLKKTLSDPTPLYALAGAGDLAYEKLREVPARVEEITPDRKGAQEKATARLQEAKAKLVEAEAKVAETVTTLPADLKELQEKAQTFALQQVGRAAEFAVRAKEVYDELAERGKVVVDRGRKDAAKEIEVSADAFAEAVAPQAVAPVETAPVETTAVETTAVEPAESVEEPAAGPAKAAAAKRSTPRKATSSKPSAG